MFDTHLTKDDVLDQIGGPSEGVSASIKIEKPLIDFCREMGKARNECYANEDSYNLNIARMSCLMDQFRMQFHNSEPFHFLVENFYIYAKGGVQQQRYAQTVRTTGFFLLGETLSNAMAVSDELQANIQITPKGVMIDIDQGAVDFPPILLEEMQKNSSEIFRLLQRGLSIQEMLSTMSIRLRKTIGYVPIQRNGDDGLPFRGNGTTNVLVNDIYRTNYIRKDSCHSTLTFHSANHLPAIHSVRSGDRRAINNVYGSVPVADKVPDSSERFMTRTEAVDAFFSQY